MGMLPVVGVKLGMLPVVGGRLGMLPVVGGRLGMLPVVGGKLGIGHAHCNRFSQEILTVALVQLYGII